MTFCHEEMTLTEALADPMTRTIMRADRVDPLELKAMLTTIAQDISSIYEEPNFKRKFLPRVNAISCALSPTA